MNRILIAADGSPGSAEAVRVGVELAAEDGAEVILVHVSPGANPYGQAFLESALEYAAEHGLMPRGTVLAGDDVDEIVAYADSLDVDLIVVGSRGVGASPATLLGSVARGVIDEARRPVLVVLRGTRGTCFPAGTPRLGRTKPVRFPDGRTRLPPDDDPIT